MRKVIESICFLLLSPQLTDQSWLPAGVRVPLHQVPFAVKGSFRFRPPSQITVVGSYLLNTCMRPDINVDVALTMPRVRPMVWGGYRGPAKGLFGTLCSLSENWVCSSCWLSQGKSPLGLKPSLDLVPSSMNTDVSDLLSSSLTPPGNLTGQRRAEPALLPQASPLPGSLSLPPGPGSPLWQRTLLLHQWMPPEALTAAATTWWESLSGLSAQYGMVNLEGDKV